MREPQRSTASAVLSAASTGLTTGTPTRSPNLSRDIGQEGEAHAAQHQHVGAVVRDGRLRRLRRLVEAPGSCLASSSTERPMPRTLASNGAKPSARSRAATRPKPRPAGVSTDRRVPSWAARWSAAAPGPITGMDENLA